MQKIVRKKDGIHDDSLLIETYCKHANIIPYYYEVEQDQTNREVIKLYKVDKYMSEMHVARNNYIVVSIKDFGNEISYSDFQKLNGCDFLITIIYVHHSCFKIDTKTIERTDPALIKTVKELNSLKAYSNLEVVEIPDDVKYFIESDEWDEQEEIVEESRRW